MSAVLLSVAGLAFGVVLALGSIVALADDIAERGIVDFDDDEVGA